MEENKKKQLVKTYLITGIISILIGLVILFIFFFANGISIISAIDGCGLAAVLLLSAGGLIYVSREGFFDFASYGFKQLGSIMFSKKPSQYDDYPGYREEMKEKRKLQSNYYVVVLLIGVIFLIALLILETFIH